MAFRRYYRRRYRRRYPYRRGGSGGGLSRLVKYMFPERIAEAKAVRSKRRAFRKQFNSLMYSPQFGLQSDPASYGVTLNGLGDYQFKGTPSVGARVGAWAGDKLGGFLGRITGLGDYTVNSNSLMGTDPPRVSNGANLREIIISHREYIGDVVTGPAGSFASSSFLLNPGNSRIFPWLSAVASCFQQYKFRGIVFEFKTMSADALNSTNTALGTVIMASNYNVLQANFANKNEMENTEYSSSCKPSASMYHPIECDPRDTPLTELYIAPNGVIPDGGTPQFYDFCNFQIATNGFQASNVNIGELWVTYEVALLKPIQPSIAGVAPNQFYMEESYSTQIDGNPAFPIGCIGGLTYIPRSASGLPNLYGELSVVSGETLPVKTEIITSPSLARRYTIGDGDTQLPVGAVVRYTLVYQTDVDSISNPNAVTPPPMTSLVNIAPTFAGKLMTPAGAVDTTNYTLTAGPRSMVFIYDFVITGTTSNALPSFVIGQRGSNLTAAGQHATAMAWMSVLPPHMT